MQRYAPFPPRSGRKSAQISVGSSSVCRHDVGCTGTGLFASPGYTPRTCSRNRTGAGRYSRRTIPDRCFFSLPKIRGCRNHPRRLTAARVSTLGRALPPLNPFRAEASEPPSFCPLSENEKTRRAYALRVSPALQCKKSISHTFPDTLLLHRTLECIPEL